MIAITETWKTTYPEAHIGLLVMHNVANPAHHPALEKRKKALERELRAQYAGYERSALKALPVMQAYIRYYKRFKKTYHVLLQLESVLKGKPIFSATALVEAVFMAELEDLLLTAVQDLDAIYPPLKLDVAVGEEQITRLNGSVQNLKARDMFVADEQGVICCIIYGSNLRTRLTPKTRAALFTTYAPAGIEEQKVAAHMQRIVNYVQMISPEAEVTFREVFSR